ncbi:hypothetical protein MIC97_22800 [Aquamicrobium sp. NLF2-7]|uniref:hypothetical protein n=1 Tax=Aquamicrobium sp. NLF2-7 TaxID=2918753 RepID=UPI001EFA6A1B|nr:hypothetical protein [Aquamicrobium sp. NLF2-7]MCG8274316.1 hypothetical protein [Aquamicrobium sp. NLF2-7]
MMNDAFSPLERLARGLLLVFILIWSVAPILFIVSSSFKRQVDIFVYPPRVVFAPTFDNYIKLVSQWQDFFTSMGNSLIVAIGATVLAGLVSFFGGLCLFALPQPLHRVERGLHDRGARPAADRSSRCRCSRSRTGSGSAIRICC